MIKIIIFLSCLIPITASAGMPLLEDDLISGGENMLTTNYDSLRTEIKGTLNSNSGAASLDGNNLINHFSLAYTLGVTDTLNLSIIAPYYFGNTSETTLTSGLDMTKFKSESPGLSDVSLGIKYASFTSDSESVVFTFLGTFATADDSEGQQEIIINGVKIQDLKKSGPGAGRKDLDFGGTWITRSQQSRGSIHISYTITGSKTVQGQTVDPGNSLAIQGEHITNISNKVSFDIKAILSHSASGVDGTLTDNATTFYGVEAGVISNLSKNLLLHPSFRYAIETGDGIKDTASDIVYSSKDFSAISAGVEFKYLF